MAVSLSETIDYRLGRVCSDLQHLDFIRLNPIGRCNGLLNSTLQDLCNALDMPVGL